MTREDYPFLYETHMHTSESSACARSTGKEMARAAKDRGYTGIIITDHSWYGNNAIDSSLPWKEWVEQFCRGYENAKEEGDRIGLDVFFGYESGYHGTEFLVFGVDKAWLIAHPEIKDATVRQQYCLIHEAKGLVIQAHPFRVADYIEQFRQFPEDVDGVEGINGAHSSPLSVSHNHPEFDRQAIAYAKENHLPLTAGSDIHRKELFGCGMAFQRRLGSIEDFCQAVREKEDYLLTDGVSWYDRTGKPVKQS